MLTQPSVVCVYMDIMTQSNPNKYFKDEMEEPRSDSVSRRLIQQHSVDSRELEGEFLESDNDQKYSSREDEKGYQFNEQRVNRGKDNKSIHYEDERCSFDSDSSGVSDMSHDQDSREYRKQDRRVHINDNDCKTEKFNNNPRQTYRDDVINAVEDSTSRKLSHSSNTVLVEESLEQRRREGSRYISEFEENEDVIHSSRVLSGRVKFQGKTRSMDTPNVVITEADVHVSNEDYVQRRRKERSDSHLHISHRNEQEEPSRHDRHWRTRSEPRKALKYGKDEVNKAEKHVHMLENKIQKQAKHKSENDRHLQDTHKKGSRSSDEEMWERDNNFHYQERGTYGRGNRRQNESRKYEGEEFSENSSRHQTFSGNNSYMREPEKHLNYFNQEMYQTDLQDPKRGNKKLKTHKSESVESVLQGNENLYNELDNCEVKRERRQNEQADMKEERTKKEHGTRYYTPQLERKQNRRGKGALLSLVSEDDFSDSGITERGLNREGVTFAPVVKAKSMKDVKKIRESYVGNEFEMPKNKLGSFQDFKPIAKTPSVSRISNDNGKWSTFSFRFCLSQSH